MSEKQFQEAPFIQEMKALYSRLAEVEPGAGTQLSTEEVRAALNALCLSLTGYDRGVFDKFMHELGGRSPFK